tara:strand:+ start:2651 stop:4471 length:1821 start_codon:yes stop_codon:yes gene_type:complete
MLRPYQQSAFDAAITYIKKCFEPCLIEAATGAGKSHIIAAIAEWIHTNSGKKVLCLAPSKELITQNHKKYLATGNPASIYCASVTKSLTHDVVFGSPRTVLNSIEKFGNNFAAIVIDEAHGITPTVKQIIEEMRAKNKKIRVIGLTATPYRLGDGYIYQYNEQGEPLADFQTKDPYFNTLVYKITASELIQMGFLTKPHAEPVHAQVYDTTGIINHTAAEYEQAFEGQGRKTSMIISEVVDIAQNRNGVMIFCATIQHAQEALESLPPANSRLVTGKTPKAEREQIIEGFKAKKFKYLVNVSVLTTGFDAEHVDVVALLRATDSVGLMQQIIGRGLRLCQGKDDCLVLDYAGNIERHCPDGDVFNPKIEARYKASESFEMDANCPDCGVKNTFKGRDNPERFDHDANGYFVDLEGNHILIDEKPTPAHHGRRCYGQELIKGNAERCNYRWSFKQCLECDHKNDIAARYCEKCKGELIDPNEKLILDFKRMKSDPYTVSTDKVIAWRCQLWTSKAGNESVRVDYTTEFATFPVWHSPSKNSRNMRIWELFCGAVFGYYIESPQLFMDKIDDFEGIMPKTITSEKDRSSKFYRVFDYNRGEDEIQQLA